MSLKFRYAAVIAVLLMLPGFGSIERFFAPSSDPWPYWEAHKPDSIRTIDHDAWDRLLAKYLIVNPSGVNLFRYGDVTSNDRALLQSYLAYLQAQQISDFNRSVQFAYWVNFYNALTIEVVLAHYPIKSIRDIDISPGFLADGPWGKKLTFVQGRELSLNDIEHRILRPIWRDPRIHYIVNCASIGCPDLQPNAFRAATMNADMDAAARAYINDPRGVKIEYEWVSVSRIYDWFIEDFGGNAGHVRDHLLKYAEPELVTAFRRHQQLNDVHYDWNLNEPKP